jgi:protein subunit release factor B
MKFPSDAPVTPKKLDELRARIDRLAVDLGEIDEQFVRSPGPGGQKVNKTASAVVLRYPPLELVVKWSRERSRALNRFLALREMVDEIEVRVSPGTSERLKERERVRERKRRRKRRSRKKKD